MVERRTWPMPPIILRNELALTDPGGLPLAQPFHLLEGHRRLGYFRAMAAGREFSLLPSHELWIAKAEASEVLAFRPLNVLEDTDPAPRP